MSIPDFNVQEQWIGDSTLTDYTFDFTIQDVLHLVVIVQDSLGNEVERVRGDDTSYLAGVVFDAINGGGTVSLQNVLPNSFVMTLLMANDAPTQPSEFKNKFSFTLERFELALDYMMTAIQRISWLATRSLRLNDVFSGDFDPQLPTLLVPDAFIKIKTDGTGFDFGPTKADLTAEVFAAEAAALASQVAAANSAAASSTSAAAALASQLASANSASAASSSATAAAASAALAATFSSGIVYSGPFAAIAPNANLNLPGETTSHADFSMVEFVARIKRGNTVYARQEFSIFYRNGAWEIAIGPDLYADGGADHGVTFTCDSVTAQINAAVANDGGDNAVIDINKIRWIL